MVLLKAVNYFRKKLHVSSEYIRQFVPGKTLTGNGWLNVCLTILLTLGIIGFTNIMKTTTSLYKIFEQLLN